MAYKYNYSRFQGNFLSGYPLNSSDLLNTSINSHTGIENRLIENKAGSNVSISGLVYLNNGNVESYL